MPFDPVKCQHKGGPGQGNLGFLGLVSLGKGGKNALLGARQMHP